MDFFSLVYNLSKDLLKWNKDRNIYEEKIIYIIDQDLSEKIKVAEEKGYTLSWVPEYMIESKKNNKEKDYFVIEQIDKKNKIRYTFRNKKKRDEILMGKKDKS